MLDLNTLIGFILAAISLFVTHILMSDKKSKSSDNGSLTTTTEPAAGFIVEAGNISDMKKGSMKDVKVGDSGMKILISRTTDGEIYATGSKCTHYGAPLKMGVLSEDRLVCPWHAASFNCKTGDIEDGPVLDALPTYKVSIAESGDIRVNVPEIDRRMRRTPTMCRHEKSNKETFLVIGSGPAGAAAVENIRSSGFTGNVIMITKENHLPYDRPKLSKAMSTSVEKLQLRDAKFYADAGIELMFGCEVSKVKAGAHEVELSDGRSIKYNKLLLATGTFCRSFQKPERFVTPGAELGNIFTMRYPSDAINIESMVTSSDVNVVIVGSSFIGMEAAAYLKHQKKITTITVIGMETVPFERVLGVELGHRMMQLHESKGVKFQMERLVGEFVGDASGNVAFVQLKDLDGENTELIKCDLVVIGAGVIPATEYLEGVELGRMGAIKCDAKLKVEGTDDIYAAGDIAMLPHWITGGMSFRVEHYHVAMQQGRIAGKNMAGGDFKYDSVPFFWTSHYTTNVRYAGHTHMVDERIIIGDVGAMKFAAYFVTKGRVAAVVTIGADPVAVAALELMRRNAMPKPNELRETSLNYLVKVLDSLN